MATRVSRLVVEPTLLSRVREGQLPGNAILVVNPSVLFAERVSVQRHENLPPLGQGRVKLIKLAFSIESHKKRHRGRECKAMLYEAVYTHKLLPVKRKHGMAHRARRANLVFPITRYA